MAFILPWFGAHAADLRNTNGASDQKGIDEMTIVIGKLAGPSQMR